MRVVKQQKSGAKPNIVRVIVVTALFLVVGGIIIVLAFSGVLNFGGGTKPNSDLAKTVCEKHGGELKTEDKPSGEYELAVSCTNASSSPDPERINEVFLFEIYYLSNYNLNERLEKARSSLGDSPYYRVLENSDDYIKVYAGVSNDYGTEYNFAAFYKNMMVMVLTYNAPLAEDLLVELGFPDRGRAEVYEVTSAEIEEEDT